MAIITQIVMPGVYMGLEIVMDEIVIGFLFKELGEKSLLF
jgi:hypothetical protein